MKCAISPWVLSVKFIRTKFWIYKHNVWNVLVESSLVCSPKFVVFGEWHQSSWNIFFQKHVFLDTSMQCPFFVFFCSKTTTIMCCIFMKFIPSYDVERKYLFLQMIGVHIHFLFYLFYFFNKLAYIQFLFVCSLRRKIQWMLTYYRLAHQFNKKSQWLRRTENVSYACESIYIFFWKLCHKITNFKAIHNVLSL
jgi:hypothetical protein